METHKIYFAWDDDAWEGESENCYYLILTRHELEEDYVLECLINDEPHELEDFYFELCQEYPDVTEFQDQQYTFASTPYTITFYPQALSPYFVVKYKDNVRKEYYTQVLPL